jgi:hypothetical protein
VGGASGLGLVAGSGRRCARKAMAAAVANEGRSFFLFSGTLRLGDPTEADVGASSTQSPARPAVTSPNCRINRRRPCESHLHNAVCNG